MNQDWLEQYRKQQESEARGEKLVIRSPRSLLFSPSFYHIPLWPNGDVELKTASSDAGFDAFLQRHFMTGMWIALMLWIMVGGLASFFIYKQSSASGTGGGYLYWHYLWQFAVFLPFFFLSRLRGPSAIRLQHDGIVFLYSIAGRINKTSSINWSDLKAITLEKDNSGKSYIQFVSIGGLFRLKVDAFPDLARWRKFVWAIETFGAGDFKGAIDKRIEEAFAPDQKDPSYTELWLEALGSAPKGQCLEPLSSGTDLKHQSLDSFGREFAYRVERQIGRGGQGTAYLASRVYKYLHSAETAEASSELTDVAGADSTPSQVVLKEYILPVFVDMQARRQAVQRFEEEARMLSSIDHPNIVKLLDFFVEDLRAYLVLEYVSGMSLKERVRIEGPLPENEVKEIGLVLCDILEELHYREPRVIHQDFTPDNLLMSADGQIKLIDFMVAKKVDDNSASAVVVGKHSYMPPEQYRGESSPLSDIYAMGATLSFLLTGEDPEPLTCIDLSVAKPGIDPQLAAAIKSFTALEEEERCSGASTARTLLTLQSRCQAPGMH